MAATLVAKVVFLAVFFALVLAPSVALALVQLHAAKWNVRGWWRS